LEKKDIASLLDALSERPLAGEGDETPPELEAFYRRALEALSGGSKVGSEAAAGLAKDPEAFAAVLAAIYAGRETEAERDAFERAAAGSADMRLDSESALAFLDGMNEAPKPTPAHLLAALETASAAPVPERSSWSFSSVWLTRRTSWRWATAFAVLVVAGGLSWSTYYRQGGEVPGSMPAGAPVAAGAAASKAAAAHVMPNEARTAAALAKPCEPGAGTISAAQADKAAAARQATPAPAPNATACGDADRQLAEKSRAADELEALRRVQAALKAEIARKDAEAASRKAAAEFTLPRPGVMGAAAARSKPGFGAADAAMPAAPSGFQRVPPAAAMTAPPSVLNRPR
jgi:hypothetical protein